MPLPKQQTCKILLDQASHDFIVMHLDWLVDHNYVPVYSYSEGKRRSFRGYSYTDGSYRGRPQIIYKRERIELTIFDNLKNLIYENMKQHQMNLYDATYFTVTTLMLEDSNGRGTNL